MNEVLLQRAAPLADVASAPANTPQGPPVAHVIATLVTQLADGLDHPELWAELPALLRRYPELAPAVAISRAHMPGLAVPLGVLHALVLALGGDFDGARAVLDPLRAEQPPSALIEGAQFHVAALADPGNPRFQLHGRLCSAPFLRLERQGDAAHLCCARWLPQPLGRTSGPEAADPWNSAEAQAIRASVLDGSYRYCLKQTCPRLHDNTLPTAADAPTDAPDPVWAAMLAGQTVLAYPPHISDPADHAAHGTAPAGDLLLHSLSEFGELIEAMLTLAEARRIVEIGAEHGGMTARLAAHCARNAGQLTTIDPAPQPALLGWLAHHPHVRHLAQTSLAVIDTLAEVDAWVIDGDHNYYTVLHELRGADALARRDGRPLLAILHDVGWPCARRDQYYAPEQIPAAWRQPYSFDAGVTLDAPDSTLGRGFRGCGAFAYALHAGGPRNGVLTAVEDFLQETRAAGRDLAYAQIPAMMGLGVIHDATAPWSAALSALLAPFHDNPFIARLEQNRLRNYLAVIDWQDRSVQG